MGNAAGFVFKILEDREEIFENSIDEYGSFAEPVPEFKHSRNLPLICLIVNNSGIITHLSKGKKGQLAGTELRRLNMSDFEILGESVHIQYVIDNAKPRYKSTLAKKLNAGGLIPNKSFQELINILIELDPSMSNILGIYSENRILKISRLGNETLSSLAQQKEAVSTAMSLANIDREELLNWDFEEEEPPSSFLDGLPQVRLREDPMVINDLNNLPGFKEIKSTPFSSVVFENDKSKLTVLLTNRLPLEKQLGTDLIYYNETFSCFLMVQYKAMEQEGEEAVYRFPNHQLTEEIDRMKSALVELNKCSPNIEADGYRLCENPFFLKLCPRITFNPDNTGLIKGMYLPLDYWGFLSEHPTMKGPKGGKRVSYKNARRYLDNSAFISIASGAWVGTTINQSSELEVLIRSSLESGRAVLFAIADDKQRRHHDDS